MNADRLKSLSGWLADGARSAALPETMMEETCERLAAAGVPLWRVGLFVRTLHPNAFGRSFIWRRGEGVVVGTADFDLPNTEEFRTSPLTILQETGSEVRRKLSDAADNTRSQILDDLRAEGVTDYIAIPLLFRGGATHASSWTTKQPGGFTDAELDGIRFVISPLTRVIEIIGLRRVAANLLDVYVGNRAGDRILAGQIRRGHTETLHAAIWLSDMRGFTPLSDRLSPETVVDVLNQYFDCQVPAILKHGGDVLKFMGDGLLAVFPIAEDGSDAGEVCHRVLEAARESRAAVDALHYADGVDVIDRFRFGLALHVGRVLYGNIGSGNRLDFTCIGPAVNLAARLEKLTSSLNRTVIASAAFARQCRSDWTDLGDFSVAGFSAQERVYGLADETGVVQEVGR